MEQKIFGLSGARIDRRSFLKGSVAGAALLSTAGTLLSRNAFAADDVIKIGWVLPLTGPLASSFGPLYIAAQIALDEINAAGGIMGKKLVKVEVDDQASPASEPVVMRHLIEEKVQYVVGPTGSSQALAALAVATPAKLIEGAYATASEMGDGKRFPYHYQFNFTADGQAVQYADYLAKGGFKKIGLLIEDSAAGASARDALHKQLPAHGLKIVSEQTFPIKTADMTPFLRKLRGDGSDALAAFVSNNVDVTQFLVGLSRINWQPTVVGHTGLLFAGTPGAIPAGAQYDRIYAATFKALTYTKTEEPPERVKKFCKLILKQNVPDSLLGPAATSPYYDFLYALKFGVEQAKSFDPDAIKKVLDTAPAIEGLFGKMSFTPERHTAYNADVVTMAVANSTSDPLSKEYRGLFRRRA